MIAIKEQTGKKHAETLSRGAVDWQAGTTEPEGVADAFARIIRQTPLSPDSKQFLFRASLPDGE